MPSQTSWPIFIVDDDPSVLSSLRFLLESEGYEVVAFHDGVELLAAFPRSSPGCLIIDVKMPGLDGIDVARYLRTLEIDTPVVLMTGHPDPSIRTRARAAGIELLEKPLSQDALLSVIDQARSHTQS